MGIISVRFLVKCNAVVQKMEYCGDGCCSSFYYESELFGVGEEISNFDECSNTNLIEGEDYEVIEDF